MICSKCGAEIKDTAKFCGSCGEKVEAASAPAVKTTPEVKPAPAPEIKTTTEVKPAPAPEIKASPEVKPAAATAFNTVVPGNIAEAAKKLPMGAFIFAGISVVLTGFFNLLYFIIITMKYGFYPQNFILTMFNTVGIGSAVILLILAAPYTDKKKFLTFSAVCAGVIGLIGFVKLVSSLIFPIEINLFDVIGDVLYVAAAAAVLLFFYHLPAGTKLLEKAKNNQLLPAAAVRVIFYIVTFIVNIFGAIVYSIQLGSANNLFNHLFYNNMYNLIYVSGPLSGLIRLFTMNSYGSVFICIFAGFVVIVLDLAATGAFVLINKNLAEKKK